MYKNLVMLFFITASSALWADPSTDNSLAANNEVRDPTTPLGHVARAGTATTDEWVLNSVLISAQRKLAIINGETVREGQLLPGSNAIKIQRILPQTVVLQQGEKTWVLKLSPSVVNRH